VSCAQELRPLTGRTFWGVRLTKELPAQVTLFQSQTLGKATQPKARMGVPPHLPVSQCPLVISSGLPPNVSVLYYRPWDYGGVL
jgi:hypothetical protein